MDVRHLNEVSQRKRLKRHAENLKEEVSEETKQVIKLRINQDTAYWELKEKLLTKEREHERLQENTIKLQMEHEAVSAQYQEELRQRPEILNKVASTREMCDVLEESLSRVRASLQRSATDRTSLAEAYTRAAAAVANAQADNEKRITAAVNEARAAQERATMSNEHNARLSESMALVHSRAEKYATEVERLRDQHYSVGEKLGQRDALLQEKEKMIQELHEQMQRVTDEFAEKCERQENVTAKLQREAGEAAALRTAIAQAESRSEASSHEVSRLAVELSLATAAKDEALQRAAALSHQKQEYQSNVEELKRGLSILVQKGEEMAKKLDVKDQLIQSLQKGVTDKQEEIRVSAERIATVNDERERERRDYEVKIFTICAENAAERERNCREYEEKVAAIITENKTELDCERRVLEERMNTAATELAAEFEQERNVLRERAAALEHDLKERTETITRLKVEMEETTNMLTNADAIISKLTSELERERGENEKRNAAVERELAEKSDTISRLMHNLTISEESLASANAAVSIQIDEREREHREFDERATATENKLAESEKAVTKLKSDLNVEAQERARCESELNKIKSELITARAHASDDILRLKASLKSKDDNAARQIKYILSLQTEKNQMSEKINDLQNTIRHIQDISTKQKGSTSAAVSPPLLRRIQPEHDDHDMPVWPAQFQEALKPQAGTPAPDRLEMEVPRIFESIFSFHDDNDSMEAVMAALDVTADPKLVPPVKPVAAPAPSVLDPRAQQGRRFFKSRRAERYHNGKKK